MVVDVSVCCHVAEVIVFWWVYYFVAFGEVSFQP